MEAKFHFTKSDLPELMDYIKELIFEHSEGQGIRLYLVTDKDDILAFSTTRKQPRIFKTMDTLRKFTYENFPEHIRYRVKFTFAQ